MFLEEMRWQERLQRPSGGADSSAEKVRLAQAPTRAFARFWTPILVEKIGCVVNRQLELTLL